MTENKSKDQLIQELRESEARFRLLAENIEEVFWMADSEIKKMSYISPGYEKVWGLSQQTLYDNPKSFIEAIHPDDRERVIAVLLGEKSGKPFELEYRIIRPDGSIRWIWDRGFPIQSEAGHVSYYVGVASDITERKKAEESLRQSEERYRTILENIEEGYDEVDLKGNIVFFNESFRKHMGYTKEELLGMNYRKYFDRENAQKSFKAYNQVYRTGKPLKQIEWEIIRKDGTKRNIAVSISLIKDASNQAIGFRSIGRDETDRKKAEEALKKSEKDLRLLSNLLIKTQEKEQKRVAIELHDDLGQSLVGLKMQLSAIQHKLEENQTELKQEVKQAADSIDLMTENVRRISRDLRPSVLEHMGLIEALQWLFESIATTHKIKIEKEIAIPKVSFSKNQEIIIFRIFQEALTNIVKHAQATQIFIDLKKEGRTAVFSIKDNGRGFNLEEIKVKKSYEGGIGLIVMKERATMAGGDLELKSKIGNGTSITFWVPIKRTR
jgi:PAS domain S-box-containing protein